MYYSQQDIFRKHLANQYAKLGSNTSMVLFPVRLETKIINRKYNKTDATATVLYLFKALWQLLCSLDKNKIKLQKVESNLKNALVQASLVQAMFPHDKHLIDRILPKIGYVVPAVHAELFNQVSAEVAKIPVIRASRHDRIERLHKEADLIRSHMVFDCFMGKNRYIGGNYSSIAYYRRWSKTLSRAISFLEKLPNEKKTFLSSGGDAKLYKHIMSICDIGIEYCFIQGLPNNHMRSYIEEAVRTNKDVEEVMLSKKQILNGHEKSVSGIVNGIISKIAKLEELRQQFSDNCSFAISDLNETSIQETDKNSDKDSESDEQKKPSKRPRPNRKPGSGYSIKPNRKPKQIEFATNRLYEVIVNSLPHEDVVERLPHEDIVERLPHKVKDNEVVEKYEVTTLCRYTLLAFYLMVWKVNRVKDKSYKLKDKKLQRVQSLASHCVFDYSEELQWMHQIVRAYNRDNADDKDILISDSDLNKTSKFIRLRKSITSLSEQESPCLCIRIYPDDLVLTQLDKSITPQEETDARYFFEEYFYNELKGQTQFVNPNISKMSGVSDCHRTAWDNLCQKYSPSRAAWIVRCVAKGGKDLVVRENNDVFTVPVTNLMPSRFSAQAVMRLGEHKELKLTGYGNRIPNVLHVGLNFNDQNASDDMVDSNSDKGLKFTSPELRWMTDYDEAERIGMAITIPLRGFEFNKKKTNKRPKDFEFNSVYVSGIKENVDANNNEGSALINDLLEARLFSDEGMDLIKIGTPTNITDGDSEPVYNSSEEHSKETFYTLLNKGLKVAKSIWKTIDENTGKYMKRCNYTVSWNVNTSDKQTDADNLSKLLSLNSIGSSVLQETPLADKNDFEKSRLANEALLSYFAEQTAGGNKKFPLFALLNTEPLRSFFLNFVSARGLYSPIRIGEQPYGITAVGDFRNLQIDDLKMRSLHSLLVFLTSKWNAVADTNRVVEKRNNGAEFLELMGKTPVSCNFEKQESVKVENFLNADYFKGADDKSIAEEIRCVMHTDDFEEIAKCIVNYKYIPLLEKKFTSKMDNDEVDEAFSPLKSAVRSHFSRNGKNIDDEEIKGLICEFFDLFTHRLDAWISGMLYYQQNMRVKDENNTIAIGGYGWVFNLKNQAESNFTKELQEHVLAPSINQAITAAVLRGAYLNRDAANDDSEVVNINLSSARVRKAIRIIEGVRNGLNVGAILGADLEHLLHEAHEKTGIEMDECIWPLRQAFPQTESDEKGKDSNGNDLLKKTPNVLNGAMLIQSLRSAVGDVNNVMNIGEYFSKNMRAFGDWCENIGLKIDEVKKSHLLACIQEIYDSYDAMMDVVLSDGVYQLCRGNVDAATAVMNAMQEEKMIPMPSVTEIPLDHARIENKVITMFDPAETFGSELSVLDTTDLRIGEWAKSVMPDFKLADYISPLDMVYLSSDIEGLKTYIQYVAPSRPDLTAAVEEYGFVANSVRDMLGQSHPVCFEDFMNESPAVEVKEWYDYRDLRNRYDAISAAVAKIAAKCGTLVSDAEEMAKTYEEVSYDSSNSNAQKSVLASLDKKKGELLSKYTQFCSDAIPMLLQCFRLGYTSVFASMARLNMLDKDIEQRPIDEININGIVSFMHEVQAEIKKRVTAASAAIEACAGVSKSTDRIDREGYECIVNAIRALTLPNVVVLPVAIIDRIYVESEDGVKQNILPVGTFSDQLNHQVLPSASVVDEYLSQMANLRPTMQSLYMQLMFSTMSDSADCAAPQFVPLQLPSHTQEEGGKKVMKWLGADDNLTEDLISDTNVYAVCNPQFVPQNDEPIYRICGLVIDFWVEKIPLKNQVAGLAFKYDQPDAEPPQAILMAMPRGYGRGRRWSEQYMLSSLKSAIHMVKCRAVEPDHLMYDKWVGGLLPLFDLNIEGVK